MIMNKLLKISYLALAFLFFCTLSLSAQIKPTNKKKTEPEPAKEQQDDYSTPTSEKKKSTKKTDSYFDESGGFKHRLWYGGNLNLGLSSLNGGSLFSIGITPMIGYKIIGGLSAGPRLGINYTSIKASDTGGGVSSVSATDYSIGLFARYKVIQNFFAHTEFEYVNQEFPQVFQDPRGGLFIQLDASGKPLKSQRASQNNTYAGLGYSSGDIFSYEIMILYNFNVPKNSFEQPITYRAGFTYKF
jgi:hypothetical protein